MSDGNTSPASETATEPLAVGSPRPFTVDWTTHEGNLPPISQTARIKAREILLGKNPAFAWEEGTKEGYSQLKIDTTNQVLPDVSNADLLRAISAEVRAAGQSFATRNSGTGVLPDRDKRVPYTAGEAPGSIGGNPPVYTCEFTDTFQDYFNSTVGVGAGGKGSGSKSQN